MDVKMAAEALAKKELFRCIKTNDVKVGQKVSIGFHAKVITKHLKDSDLVLHVPGKTTTVFCEFLHQISDDHGVIHTHYLIKDINN